MSLISFPRLAVRRQASWYGFVSPSELRFDLPVATSAFVAA